MLNRTISLLFLMAILTAIASYAACSEGVEHDQSGCVIDLSLRPPFFGFEYWQQVGIALALLLQA